MADQSGILASLLLGQKQRTTPSEQQRKYGSALMQQGSSVAPLGSGNPLEGLARALQGGLGGFLAGQANTNEETQSKANIQGLANYLQAKTPDEEQSALKGLQGGDPDIVAPMLANMISNKQKLGIAGTQADQFGKAVGSGAPNASSPAQSGGYQTVLASSEGGSGPSAATIVNPQSGAGGQYQFLPETWNDVRSKNPDLNLPATVQEAPLPLQAQAEQRFRAQNGQTLQAAGIPATPGNLYLAHRAGAQGAQAILGASPDTPLSTIVPAKWLEQNPDMRTTAGQFVAQANQRFSQNGGAAAPGVPGPIAQPQIAQGDGPGAAASSSVTSGPPEIPRPQATPEQIQKYQRLIASGGLTQPQALQELDKEISGQWQMQRQQALEVWKDQQSSRRIQEQGAQRLGQEAPMKMIEARVSDYEKNVRPKAEAANGDILALHQVRQILDAGAFTGTGAEYKTQIAKLGEQLGIPSEQAQNTQILGSVLANRTLAAAGGSLGTGFSNADRDFMEKAKGGQITMDEPALRRLADIGERQARQVLKNHDVAAERLQKLPGLAALGSEQFQVQNAPGYDEWNKANPLAPLQSGNGTPRSAPGGVVAPAPAIERLRANPAEAAQFDEIFGPGAAAKVLGR